MKTIRLLIKNKKGEGYIDLAITLLIIVIFMVGLLSIFPLITTQQSLNVAARQIARLVEVTGSAGSDVEAAIQSMDIVQPDSITWDTTWLDPSEKTIQLKTPFKVTVSKNVQVIILRPAVGEPVAFNLTISSAAEGISEVYHKK